MQTKELVDQYQTKTDKGNKMKCTSCDKELTDLRIRLALAFEIERLTEADIWEQVPNSISKPQETLCKECFSDFVDLIDKKFNGVKNVPV